MIVFHRAHTVSMLASNFAASSSAQTQWDMPTNYAASSFPSKNIARFAADIDDATGGSLRIAVHPAGSLIKHAEIKPAVRKGSVPIGEILESLVSSEAPVYGIDSIPFLVTSYDASKKLYAAQKPFLEKQLVSEGLMLLFSVPWPPQGIYAKREIKSVDDLKGLKFRTYNAMIGRIATLAGATPTQIEVPDLPAAFASGRVDVMITSASSGVESKAENYLTHYIDTQAWLPRNIVFVNKEAFGKLSAVEQKAVLDAAKTAEARGWQLSIDEMTIKTAALKANGIIVAPPTPQLKAGLAKIGDTIAAEWKKSAGADAAMLAAYRK
jgi:TRAP-type C4-dicarboxylate transport system substrate-binding protein